jgi:hypothetical protein
MRDYREPEKRLQPERLVSILNIDKYQDIDIECNFGGDDRIRTGE